MIKRIEVSQLITGMYISDLDCGWLSHPFVANQFDVSGQEIIDKIRSIGLRNVYIDTEKGLDVGQGISREEVQKQVDDQSKKIAKTTKVVKSSYTVKEELANAGKIFKDAHQIIHNLLIDARLGRQLELERIEPVVEKMTDSIFRNKDALITLCRVKNKDEYTFLHSVSVSVLMMAFARVMGFDKAEIQQIGMGGLLHDVGKMKVSQAVLNKPGKYTEQEFEEMKRHVEYGCDIVRDLEGITPYAYDVIAQHHERVDGSGYPNGLNGDNMSIVGKMSSIVDVYDALTSVRVYKQAWEPSETLRKFIEWSKHHFNEELVHHFIRCVGIYPVGTVVHLSNETFAVVIEQGEKNLISPKVRVVYDVKKNKALPTSDLALGEDKAKGIRILNHVIGAALKFNPVDFLR